MRKILFMVFITALVVSLCVVSEAKKVTIIRDNYGIPHVFGDSMEEVFYGYGYALATDRLFQIEILRRSYYGRSRRFTDRSL